MNDDLPDARDGLTQPERVVLKVLHDVQRERQGRHVPTLMLYGRVVEIMDMSQHEFQVILNRLGVRAKG
ncbi:MAG: hypothetical protein CME36_14830 [unclassified Hahellaceae]|nr:hypothetical protein [Hahellaceae bacterium]|tara:strand:- start:501 stop:707 length:207 start_codon:yes stop_codon:yes gene_type:complete